MTAAHATTPMAERMIRDAIARLAGEYPFHAGVLERFKIVCRPDVATMAVTVAGDDVVLYHNPEFVLAISADELAGVLLHEVHHVVLGHVLAHPAGYADRWALVVAQEVAVNEFVKLPLPCTPITLDHFPGLPPMESTNVRYDRLKRVRARGRITLPGEWSGGRAGGGGPAGHLAGPVADAPEGGGRGRAGPRDSCGRPVAPDPGGSSETLVRAARGGHTPGDAGDLGCVVDDHGVWEEAWREPRRSRAAVREVVDQALHSVGPAMLPDRLQPAVEALGVATGPRQEAFLVPTGQAGHLDWRQVLRRIVSRASVAQPAFDRPPRRFPELVGVLPGRRRRPARPRILAIIDTSESITTDLLERIDAELARLARRSPVTVVECDSAIRRVASYRRLESVLGRGATDLRPPLERSFLRAHRPDLVISVEPD